MVKSVKLPSGSGLAPIPFPIMRKISATHRTDRFRTDMDKTLKYINGETRCFGCGACVAACPQNCIRMKPDSEGFLLPVIDFSTCFGCRRCIKVCPVNTLSLSSTTTNKTDFFLARRRTSPDTRHAGASGGVFTALSNAILRRDGAVAGAVWTADFSVLHSIAYDQEGRDAMCGAKYVQSDSSQAFEAAAELLREERPLLFSGTPCQIAALYSFLGRNPDHLITMDWLCDGAPSPLVFREYRRFLAETHHAELTAVRFRPVYAETRIEVEAEFSDGSRYRDECGSDPYCRLLLSHMIIRPSCVNCPYAGSRRETDLPIVSGRYCRNLPAIQLPHSEVLVLVHTERGHALLRSAEPELEIHPFTPLESDRGRLFVSVRAHPDRKLFFRALRRHGFSAAAASYTGPRTAMRKLRSGMLCVLRSVKNLFLDRDTKTAKNN